MASKLTPILLQCFLVASGFAPLPTAASSGQLDVKDASGNSLFSYRNSFALVIWAGDYTSPFWKKLNNIRGEAAEVEGALKRQGFQVTIVANPTSVELRDSIEAFIQSYGFTPENRLVFFFAGHGWTRNNDVGYFVPVDAPDASNVAGDLDFAKRALSMEQIVSWSKQMEAKHVLFIFDSCFSGTIFKVRSGSRTPAYLERKMSLPVREFLTAGDANEEVPARSIFTPLLVRGLDGAADLNHDGYITGSELGEYLPQAMAEYTTSQNPQYGKIRDPRLDAGDIVFLNPNPVSQSVEGDGRARVVNASGLPLSSTLASPSSPGSLSSPSPSTASSARAASSVPSAAAASPPLERNSPVAVTTDPTTTQPRITPTPPQPPTSGKLHAISGESIVDASSAERAARERLPKGAIEQRRQCTIINVASTDHHRCVIWYFTADGDSAQSSQ